ncbi:MAG: PIN domain-containing protein [Alphaproteobacteria bacterium]|nr:PIN domain-containing protein [Alphaproteobacteria bacterium]
MMANGKSHLFWDSCVFNAFLRDERDAYDVDSIAQYLTEAREGKHQIYASSLVFAELLPSAITKPGIGSFNDFVEDVQGAITIVDTTPNIMQAAAYLRDLPYKKGNSPGRRLATPDAIMLATAILVRDQFGVSLDFFHTFDDVH